MSLEHLAGAAYGPVSLVVSPIKVREYIDATGDDPTRWAKVAPPSYAGALLFVIAPMFLYADGVRGQALVHTDQHFVWHRPIPTGATVTVAGGIDKVRSRGTTSLVSMSLTVSSDGDTVVEGKSGFLVADGVGGAATEPRDEPPVAHSAANEIPGRVDFAGAGPLPVLAKSASRADLVRYAGASGDFNPIHWDHDSATSAGLAGTIVHGLLTMAWATQLAASAGRDEDPLAEMAFRFRQPILPGEAAFVGAEVTSPGSDLVPMDVTVSVADSARATGKATVRR